MEKHVFFDLDRTLWDFDRNSVLVLREMYHDHLAQLQQFTEDEFVASYIEINEVAWEQYRSGQIPKDELRWVRFYRTLDRFDIQDRAMADRLGHQYVERSPYQRGLVPGSLEILEYLSNKGYVLHILTNGFEEIQHIKVRETGIGKYIRELITSESVGFQKPHPNLFAAAKLRAGIPEHHAFMVGDDLEVDIEGAQAAGMTGIYFNPSGKEHAGTPHHEVKELIEIQNIL